MHYHQLQSTLMQSHIRTTQILGLSYGHILNHTIKLQSLLKMDPIDSHWHFSLLEQLFDASAYNLSCSSRFLRPHNSETILAIQLVSQQVAREV